VKPENKSLYLLFFVYIILLHFAYKKKNLTLLKNDISCSNYRIFLIDKTEFNIYKKNRWIYKTVKKKS